MKNLELNPMELTNYLQPIPLRDLQVRTLTPEERPRVAQLLDQEHPRAPTGPSATPSPKWCTIRAAGW